MSVRSEILVGDCIEMMQTLPAESAPLIFADPPYNFGIDYGKGRHADRLKDYYPWCRQWLRECDRLISPGGALWVLVPEQHADWFGAAMSDLMPRQARIIWVENFAQYNDNSFTKAHRHLFYHTKGERKTWNPGAIRIPSQRMLVGDKRAAGPRVPSDVWDVSRLQGNCHERVDWHPCQLRQWPLERIVLACSNPGDLVIDAFCGSGSMGLATKKHGRDFVGIELNPEYAAMARRRIDNPHPEPEIDDVPGQITMWGDDA